MPSCCVVPLCSERTGGHKFPKNRILYKWLLAIRRDNFKPSVYSRVCKKHFDSTDYSYTEDSILSHPNLLLKKDEVPSIFSWNKPSEINKRNKERSQRVLNCQQRKQDTKLSGAKSNYEEESCFQLEQGEESVEMEIESQNRDVEVQCSLYECQKDRPTDNIPKTECNIKYQFRIDDWFQKKV